MPDLSSTFIAALTGFLSGLCLSIPVGPVNLTLMNEGARRGFQYAFLVGLGATLMEMIYCSLAFTGLASFFSQGLVKTVMQVFSFAFMMLLGMKFLLVQSFPARSRVASRLESRFHPTSAFANGFVNVLGNPGILLGWIILGANFISRGWVLPGFASKAECVLGVALGTNTWFTGVSYAVSRGHRKFSDQTLLLLSRGSGVGLLLLGLFNGWQIVWQLTRARHNL